MDIVFKMNGLVHLQAMELYEVHEGTKIAHEGTKIAVMILH